MVLEARWEGIHQKVDIAGRVEILAARLVTETALEIPLDQTSENTCCRQLGEHLERQLRDVEILGDRSQDQGLVFATDTGAPINPSTLRQRSFASLLKRAGLPHMRSHDLRHTCATLLLSRGVHPKFVQELLGHATISITLATYSHVMPSMGDATANAMEDALS
jgi:integrase